MPGLTEWQIVSTRIRDEVIIVKTSVVKMNEAVESRTFWTRKDFAGIFKVNATRSEVGGGAKTLFYSANNILELFFDLKLRYLQRTLFLSPTVWY